MICAGGPHEVDPSDRRTVHEVVGWVERRPRGTGGVHAIKFRRETGRAMCVDCQRKLRDTGTTEQGALL